MHPNPSQRKFIIEPQEIAFGLLYTISAARLAAAGIFGGTFWILLLLFLGGIAVAALDQSRRTANSRRLRLICPIAIMPVAYAVIPKIAALTANGAAALQHADSILLGGDLSVQMQGLVNAPLTELLAACYVGFFPLILSALCAHGLGPLPRAQFLLRLLGTLYGIGFLGYTLLPAAGPYLEMTAQFSIPLTGGPVTKLYHAMMASGSNRVDCFPSLHCAISGAILLVEWKFARRRFRWLLAPVIGIWVATIYLRQHYFTDVLAGGIVLFLIAKLVGAWLSDIESLDDSVESINFHTNARRR